MRQYITVSGFEQERTNLGCRVVWVTTLYDGS